MGGWMDGWMNELMDGWVVVWTNGYKYLISVV